MRLGCGVRGSGDESMAFTVATIGYEQATQDALLEVLKAAGIQLLVDVRAVAASRRPGFAKRQLAAGAEAAGIGYLHLRGLGTPAEGRLAARSGKPERMRAIFADHLATGRRRRSLRSWPGSSGAGSASASSASSAIREVVTAVSSRTSCSGGWTWKSSILRCERSGEQRSRSGPLRARGRRLVGGGFLRRSMASMARACS